MKMGQVRRFAMSLPEVTETPHHNFGSFRVRGKIFVTMPPGDEFVHLFVPEQVREHALAAYSSFVEKLLWGSKVLGVRVTLAQAEAGAVKKMIREAWEHKAPKRQNAWRPRYSLRQRARSRGAGLSAHAGRHQACRIHVTGDRGEQKCI